MIKELLEKNNEFAIHYMNQQEESQVKIKYK